MKPKSRRAKLVSLPNSRWTAYLTAGAATAIGCAATTQEAVADIHYSGPIGQFFSGNSAYFQLDQPGDSINPFHTGSAGSGIALFFMYGVNAGSVAGFAANGFQYASRLAAGVNLNGFANFVPGQGTMGYLGGYANSQWLSPGTAFIGFRFDGGSGLQYGWARITTDGAPGNTFTLVDFAWADLGTQIAAGQTAIPEPGSLALLAVGAAGLVAWRRKRAAKLAA
jgi:hypothetical protein